eukprot:4955172-Amphidinium_carterae.1
MWSELPDPSLETAPAATSFLGWLKATAYSRTMRDFLGDAVIQGRRRHMLLCGNLELRIKEGGSNLTLSRRVATTMIIGARSSARRQVFFNTVRPNSDAASFLLQLASGLTADIAQRSYTLYGSTNAAPTQAAPGQSRLASRGEQTLQWARLISELGLTGPQEINHTSLWLRALCNAVSLLNVVQGERRRW